MWIQLSRYWAYRYIYFLHFTLNVVHGKTVRDINDIRTLARSNIVKNTKQMEILDISFKRWYIEKNIGSIENLKEFFL